MHTVLENQIQALSRTFRQRYKDFEGPRLFSRTFKALKIFKKIQVQWNLVSSPPSVQGQIVARGEVAS